jgi:hypothetical protein
MNLNTLAKNYDKLTAEERFTLIVNAGDRCDDAEQKRLLSSAPRITLSMSHHAPFAAAFQEMAAAVLLELLHLAGEYYDALDMCNDQDDTEAGNKVYAEADGDKDGDGEPMCPEVSGEIFVSDRCLGIFLAAGFILKVKLSGWQCWCERRHLPPFRSWKMMPGYDRLQRALKLTQQAPHIPGGAAFTSKGMLQWLNRVRPTGEPELSAVPLSAEGQADALESLFQDCVRGHGGV